ncbi:D-alanyl-D-alanine carboxypeptidase [Shinella kummerowiae]|uniref:D-alanyl-D-alanine carboxypeptidase n=1 Tax=Shinella kummerowiae TaxID=417745 RepID=A0A6N8SFD1_9HYPH|nr:D-alanyl-D-alanine carboxypeptidase [Shinella kummerowiae]MCT7666678.1 D-alanyl-D-alanine carboxypeptidase [Shinella kummerowiae]MXN46026.1 D-alanyl-D-alanine carboxypeptidase [Shinella kummerowiae]
MKSNVVSRSVFLDFLPRSCQAIATAAKSLVMIGMVATVVVATPAQAAPKYAGIVIDAKTGKVLYSEDADQLRYPASLTKMMTLYLTFEALEAGKIRLNTRVPFSKNAASEPPTKLGVGTGNSITVEQAMLGLITRSANDASTALAEFLGGSEERFARIMTQKARALGMTRTVYRNANGLPNTAQVTTARDQARLGLALRQHFPQYYSYFSVRSFRFGKQTINGHNRLLGSVRGVDGIKTGYTRASGYNLVTSAVADGRSVVGVVLGGRSGAARDQQMRKLIAAYMPKASRRGGGDLIAETKDAPTLTAEANDTRTLTADVASKATVASVSGTLDLPENGPVPTYRYNEARIETAYAATAEDSSSVVGKRALAATLKIQRDAAVPPAELTEQGDTNGDVDELTTSSTTVASTATPSGWVIQIGATPDQGQASDLLAKAKNQGGKALSSAQPFTVAVNSGSGQLYRARFGGFDNQNGAAAACKALKRKGFACWASQQ